MFISKYETSLIIHFCSSSENFDLKMKYAENAVQDLELRLRQLSSLTENINPCLDTVPRDCSEVQSNKSGVYLIRPIKSNKPFNVTCDMDIDGGGWTVSRSPFEFDINLVNLLNILKICKSGESNRYIN